MVLISFHEVVKLKSAEFYVSDLLPENEQNSLPLVSFPIFVSFMAKQPSAKIYVVFNHFSQTYGVTNV